MSRNHRNPAETSRVPVKPKLEMTTAQRFAIPPTCLGFQYIKVHDIAICTLPRDRVFYVKNIKMKERPCFAVWRFPEFAFMSWLLPSDIDTFVSLGSACEYCTILVLFLFFTPVLGACLSVLKACHTLVLYFSWAIALSECCLQLITAFLLLLGCQTLLLSTLLLI